MTKSERKVAEEILDDKWVIMHHPSASQADEVAYNSIFNAILIIAQNIVRTPEGKHIVG